MLHYKRTFALLLLAGLAVPARAEDKKAQSSFHLIPADAAYYGALLRNREQFDAVVQSKAWTRITQLPFYQTAAAILQLQYASNENLAPFREWAEQDENKDLLRLIRDAVSDDMFCYAAANLIDFLDLYSRMTHTQSLAQIRELVQKGFDDDQTVDVKGKRALLRVLARNADKINVPDFIVGFKIKNAKKAQAQIKRLEKLLQVLVMMQPILEGRVKRVKVGDGDFLTLNLDGKMLPLDNVDWKDIEEKPGEFDGVVKSLKRLKLTIAVGVRDGFLMLSIGSGTDGLKKLGGKGPRLIDRPKLKPLARAADKRLTSIGYTSKALRKRTSLSGEDVDTLATLVGYGLDAAGISKAKRKAIDKDLAVLNDDLKKSLPAVGMSLSFSFLSERGCESFEYDHSEFPERDASKPLTLLQHVGGDPILAVVGRSKGTLQSYQMMAKWIAIVFGHAESVLLEKMDGDDGAKKKYEQVRAMFVPLLKRFDEVTSKMLLPALADGQAGFVLDAKWKSKQWQAAMPAMSKAIPMPELGFLAGVSDADLLQKAVKSYAKIFEDTMAKVREIAPPSEVPPVELPRPDKETKESGKLFVFRLPKNWKLDKRVAPTAGLSEKVAVLALSAEHAERMLTRTPLKVEGSPLANSKRPLTGASYFRCAALVDALSPLVIFDAELAKLVNVRLDDDTMKKLEQFAKQERIVLDALKVFRVSTSATYVEDGVLVTHGETVIRDQ